MVLNLPKPDEAADAVRAYVREQANHYNNKLALLEIEAAARIVRGVWGKDATRVLFEKDEDDDGTTRIDMLIVVDDGADLLWFDYGSARYDCWAYPGAEQISDDHGRPNVAVDQRVVQAVVEHITEAYDASGLAGALGTAEDDFFEKDSPGINLIELDVDLALSAYHGERPPL